MSDKKEKYITQPDMSYVKNIPSIKFDIIGLGPDATNLPFEVPAKTELKFNVQEVEMIEKLVAEAKAKTQHLNLKEYSISCVSTLKGGDNTHSFILTHKQTKEEIPLLSFYGSDEARNLVWENFKTKE